MITATGFGQFSNGLLIKKLDLAMQLVSRAKFDGRLSEEEKDAAYQLEGHGLVYAGLLSDIQAKRVDGADPGIQKLVGIAEEYCNVVNSIFMAGAAARSST
jgi:hypothetical protein